MGSGLFGILGQPSAGGGILGAQTASPWTNRLSIIGAALQDAGANLNGNSSQADHLTKMATLLHQQQVLQALSTGVNSDDPAARQQAYSAALMNGIDPKPFQQAQAAKAMPQLLQNMQGGPGTPINQPAQQAQLPNGPMTIPAINWQGDYRPENMTDALSSTNSPELKAQMAPEIIKQQIDAQAEANKPYSLSPGEHRFVGGKEIASLPEKNNPNQPFNADGTPNPAYQAYEKAKEAASQAPAWANYNLSQKRFAFDQQKYQDAIPSDDTLHDMAVRYVHGDKTAFGSMGRNPRAQTAAQNMISQVGRELGLAPQQISQNQQTFQAGTKAIQAFDSGPQANTVRSLNVAIQHLDVLGGLADALHNGNIQAVNRFGNAIATETGNAAPTNFNAAKAIVGDEIIKAIVGSGGALADRENAQNQINAANSPAQLTQIVKTYKALMAGQLHGLRKQYENSTGRDDFNAKLFPETVQQLEAVAAPKAVAPLNAQNLPRVAPPAPAGVDPNIWKFMTPQERALWK